MPVSTYAVVGIGNAIVDVIAQATDSFVAQEGLTKGSMNLIDADRATHLYASMGSALEMSGGSAANTIAGVAALGGRAAYIGKVANDLLGEVFRHDIHAIGVAFDSVPLEGQDPPTARSLILVTPDAQRTMNTFLGACVELTPDDVDPDVIAGAEITYMEGYLFDRPAAKAAFQKAGEIAHAAGRKVSLTLSDTFCVERHGQAFRDLIDGYVDILFGNEHELQVLYGVNSLDEALEAVRGRCEVAAITRSVDGSVIQAGDHRHDVPIAPAKQVVDSTGAGDLYAAGFLYGFTQGHTLPECGRIGSIAAAEVISHYGARPEADLKALIR